jgi:hypothetical protein
LPVRAIRLTDWLGNNHFFKLKASAAVQTFDLLNFRYPMKKHVYTLISIALITPAGFCSKFYTGPGADWANNSLGGVFYEIFWCLAVFFFSNTLSPLRIAAFVFVCTCGLEFLQLRHPPFLEFLRSFFIGRTILGTTFAWSDFPYYILGSGIGWFWMKYLETNRMNAEQV